uniref:Uncharacterized protein n=1 Tax=Nonomuraea gerenzanensis TaxID=93944 RepID=A0A1M4EHL5_9ACTN|nr:hypothetical protein BN4615_P7752 [Nonomuraea gerenzanensis]
MFSCTTHDEAVCHGDPGSRKADRSTGDGRRRLRQFRRPASRPPKIRPSQVTANSPTERSPSTFNLLTCGFMPALHSHPR